MPTRYDKEFKQNIIDLYKQGESAAQLAREYGIGYSTVHKWIQGQAKTQSGKSPDEIKAMQNHSADSPCLEDFFTQILSSKFE
ncbi:MAG: transposase [Liquorilactobacillus hordei]|uniref:transposase n=1 Tax=Lactobacillaceae TaxID=33958 RepID=UPI002958B5B2|nr:transposase [Lentilactobacillus hilgardii]